MSHPARVEELVYIYIYIFINLLFLLLICYASFWVSFFYILVFIVDSCKNLSQINTVLKILKMTKYKFDSNDILRHMNCDTSLMFLGSSMISGHSISDSIAQVTQLDLFLTFSQQELSLSISISSAFFGEGIMIKY